MYPLFYCAVWAGACAQREEGTAPRREGTTGGAEGGQEGGANGLLLRRTSGTELFNLVPEGIEEDGLGPGTFLKLPERLVQCGELASDLLEGRALLTVESESCGFGRRDPVIHDPVHAQPARNEHRKDRYDNW